MMAFLYYIVGTFRARSHRRSLTYSNFSYFQSVQCFLHPYQMATSMVQVMSKARVGGLAVTMVMLWLATTFYSVLSREFGMLVFLHV